jgi:hypothetical protein
MDDYSSAMIQHPKHSNASIDFSVASVLDLPFEEGNHKG